MNILVYSGAQTMESWRRNDNLMLTTGNGSTVESVRHCLFTLRRLLAPNYAVIPVTGDMLVREPWTSSCAAIVFPGGADQGYCRTLNGEGNRRIKQYVERGGKYIGFCAGGYYGSQRCEFEVGNKLLEVIGDRELAFYPGIARGCSFAGFVYHSEKGARAVDLAVNKTVVSSGTIPNVFKSYYNGGGVFVDAPKFKNQGVEVVAEYTDQLDVDAGEGSAAIVYCKVGDGAALLTGPHPEFVYGFKAADNWSLTKPRFAASNIPPKQDVPGFSKVVEALAKDEKHRMDFLKACLVKLGLTISEEQNVPSLSRIHLSSLTPPNTKVVLSGISELVTKDEQGEDLIKDENDTFHVVQPANWKMANLAKPLPTEGQYQDGSSEEKNADQSAGSSSDQIIDYNAIIKQLLIHDADYPDAKQTPYFNHNAFYANLKQYASIRKVGPSFSFGSHLLYGEVVTSTNTLLEKNTKILRRLPQGMVFTATVQVAGRGRGSNVWVSPAGSLMFSVVIRHPMTAMSSAPVVFIQYLAAMAIVDGIKNYGAPNKTYAKMPIKLKWPNDIFALDPVKARENGGDRPENYTKIGGILVNSHYNAKEYIAVCGVGLNVSNAAPTTSVNDLISLLPSAYRNSAEPFTLEKLLASILISFEDLYNRFMVTGFDTALENVYYEDWLHMDQIVTLETEGGARAQIRGITRDYGLLVAEELGWQDRPTGRKWTLMSDSNSFDFFKGLLKRKI